MTKNERDMMIRVTLVLTHSEQQRRSFIIGYNDGEPMPNSSPQMRRDYALGQAVRVATLEPAS